MLEALMSRIRKSIRKLKEEDFTYYFAYGSNINSEQMKRRCPSAKLVRTLKITKFKLVFKTYADLEQTDQPLDEVYGVIWKITDQDVARLDQFEGFPRSYSKNRMRITITVPQKRTRKVLGFFNRAPKKQVLSCLYYKKNSTIEYPPSQIYYDTIGKGYDHFKFPRRILRLALHSATEAYRLKQEADRLSRDSRSKIVSQEGE